MSMQLVLKYFESADIYDLETERPLDENCFGFQITAVFGEDGKDGSENFDIMVCTPSYLEKIMISQSLTVLSGRHYIFMREYNIEALHSYLVEYAKGIKADTWSEASNKLGRIGLSEFEDYVPHSPPI